jgi:hypothetical protein
MTIPHGVGCGLAKGRWEDYRALIVEFAKDNPDIEVTIVRKQ